MREAGHTSQCFRIAERPPATDLRGGKASEDSLTVLMASLVVEYAVDSIQPDFLLETARGSVVGFEGCRRSLCLSLKADRLFSETAWLSASGERMIRRTVRTKGAHVPPASLARVVEVTGVTVEEGPSVDAEGPTPGSGSARGGPTLSLFLRRARRRFHGREKTSFNRMLSSNQRRWEYDNTKCGVQGNPRRYLPKS